jgi:hypothetical protein
MDTHLHLSAAALGSSALSIARATAVRALTLLYRLTAPASAADAPQVLTLQPGQTRRLAPGSRLQLDAGRLWLTCSDDPIDYMLQPGDSFEHSSSGRVVIEADGAEPVRLRLRAR